MTQAQILVVEDELIIAKNIEKRLEHLGYGVSGVVSSGEQALQSAAAVRPDLVLMDINLKGGMDGVEAAQYLRARFDVPVIYLTAYADGETLERAKLTEPYGYVLKPFETQQLHAAIEMALYKYQAEKTMRELRAQAEVQRDLAEQRLRQVQALRAIDLAIGTSFDPRFTLNIFIEQIALQLGVDAVAVRFFNPHTQQLEYAAGRGFRTRVVEHSRLRLGEGLAGRAGLERRTIAISDVRLPLAELEAASSGYADPQSALRPPQSSLAQLEPEIAALRSALGPPHLEGIVGYYAVPLIARLNLKGVLELFHRAPLTPDVEWLSFLDTLALETANAIDNAEVMDHLQRSHTDLSLAYELTVESWVQALDERNQEKAGHTQRVTELAVRLARALHVNEAQLPHLRRGALLHDVGEMCLPDSILLKPGPLTEAEWVVVRRHPAYAHELLSHIAFLRPALDIPYCHHEKWDGTGYPRGLKGEQIPLAARLFAVVDVWGALHSDRPYRPAWPDEQVCSHLRANAGTHFDPRAVDAFLSLLEQDRPDSA